MAPRPLTFDALFEAYSPFLRDRYARSWGTVYADARDQSDSWHRGYLCGVEEEFGYWIETTFRRWCEEGEVAVVDDAASVPTESLWTLDDRSRVLFAPFQLQTWAVRNCVRQDAVATYAFRLANVDDLAQLHLTTGRMMHTHGVASEKYRERGWIDETYRDIMFRAMMVDARLGELLYVTRVDGPLYNVLQHTYY